MPRIENWFKYGDGIAGKITGHPNQESFKSDCQWTSKIEQMSEEEGWAETQSGTRYTLGKKLEPQADKKIPVLSRR